MKKISKGMLMAALICGSFSVLNVASAEEMQTFEMDEFVVTASRVATSKVDTPANISVINSETLAEKNYSDVTEALADVPGVNMLGSGAKGTNMGDDPIMINGDTRVLVLIDGRRVNLGSSGTTGANMLPPVEAIERVEVLKGGGSALYGTDAVGGVINIITKKGSDVGNKVTLRAVGGSWGTEQYGLTASGTNESGLGVFVAASKERRGNFDYKNQHGGVVEMKNSGYNTEGVNVKLDQTIGDDDRITFAFEHNNSEGGSPFGYYPYNLSDNFKRINNNVSLRYDWNETNTNQGYIQVYKNHQHSQFFSEDTYNQSNFIDESVGIELQQNFKLDDKSEMTAGVDYYKTNVENEFAYAGERSINNKAVFVEHRWKFDDSWQLNTGVRYDKHSEYGSEVTPKIALNKKINEDSNVYLSWGKVFNAPTTDELYNNNTGMGESNPNLNPENGDVWTLGGNTKLSDKTSLSASIFYSNIDDAIDWYDTGVPIDPSDPNSYTLWKVENVNKEKRRGMELSINHNFDDHLSAYASYTYMQIKQDKGNGYERNTKEKPNTYKVGLKYKNAGWTYTADMTAVSGQMVKVLTNPVYNSYDGYTDRNYFVLNLGAQYKVNDNLKIFANAYNLTDARYQEYGGYGSSFEARYPMPSRSFIIGAEYTF